MGVLSLDTPSVTSSLSTRHSVRPRLDLLNHWTSVGTLALTEKCQSHLTVRGIVKDKQALGLMERGLKGLVPVRKIMQDKVP